MSLSKECGTCPFDSGFETEPGKILTVCGDPSQRCINLKSGLIDKLALWMRFGEIAESAKGGSVAFDQLGLDDVIQITCSAPGNAYGNNTERAVRIAIANIDDSGLHGTVLFDTYNDSDDLEKKHYAIPQAGTITLLGACETTPDIRVIKGELHCGRFVSYKHPDFPDTSLWGMNVQEITVIDAESQLSMRIFDTDPSIYRPAAPLQS